ncbi:MAG: hypothetical protein RLZZ528_1445 [Pseudomonadota bacterium]
MRRLILAVLVAVPTGLWAEAKVPDNAGEVTLSYAPVAGADRGLTVEFLRNGQRSAICFRQGCAPTVARRPGFP